jgi:hypothetical protein
LFISVFPISTFCFGFEFSTFQISAFSFFHNDTSCRSIRRRLSVRPAIY